MTSFVPKMLVVSNRHKLRINSSYLATLYSCIPEFMRKRSVLTVAQTTQKFVGKLSLQEIATLAVIWEISNSNLRGTQRGFLLNALKTLCRLSRVLSDLWKCRRRYEICTCSVVLGQFESFRNYKGFSIIFPKILDVILSFTNVRIFLIPLSIAFLNPKILGFLFSTSSPGLFP